MKCEDLEIYFIDYLEDNLNEELKEEVERHIENCEVCKKEIQELRKFHEDIKLEVENIEPKSDFIFNIKEKIVASRAKTKKRKRIKLKTLLIAAAIICISILTVLASENGFLKFWGRFVEENSAEDYLNNGLANSINISKTDKDIKITIDSIVADDLQTLVFYTIENLKDERRIDFNLFEGITLIEDSIEYSNSNRNYTLIDSDATIAFEKNVRKGKLVLNPLKTKEGKINLNITKLQVLKTDANIKDKEDLIGNWAFEIPVKKYPSKVYDINKEIILEEIPITFTKITIAPTMTILEYKYKEPPRKEFRYIDISVIDRKEKKEYKELLFGGFSQNDTGEYDEKWRKTRHITFRTMYFNDVKDIYIKINKYTLSHYNPKYYFIDLDKPFPQEIEYMGSKIIFDNLKIEKKNEKQELINFTIKEDLENRKYETVDFDFHDFPFAGAMIRSGDTFIDEDNNKYEYYDALGRWDEIKDKKPKAYSTFTNVQIIKFNNIPKMEDKNKIKVYVDNYTKTYFCDKKVKTKLK